LIISCSLNLSGESVTFIADELGIAKSTLYNWIKKFKPVTEEKKFTAKDFNNLKQRTNRQSDMIEILKTVECNAHSPLQEKLCEIEKLYGKYSVHVLCDALNIPRGTFYNHIKRNKRDNVWYKKRREYFCGEIRRIFEENNQIFGARKIAAVLRNNGEQVSDKYVRKLTVEMNLNSIRTNSKKEYLKDRRKRNILKQQFNVDKPNTAWVSDITYYKYNDKCFFICAIIDLFSRKVIAYKISKNNSTQLTKSTVKIAIESRHPNKGLIFHNDHGANYTSATFSKYLTENGITQSFSKVRNPYDNSVAESFFSSLKREELYRRKIKSEYELKQIICEYIDFYNNRRPHATINYKTPNQYECEYFGNTEKTSD
jgi:putative transposase